MKSDLHPDLQTDFLQIYVRPDNRLVTIAKSSVALVEDKNDYCLIVLKERDKDGINYSYEAVQPNSRDTSIYFDISINLDLWSRHKP